MPPGRELRSPLCRKGELSSPASDREHSTGRLRPPGQGSIQRRRVPAGGRTHPAAGGPSLSQGHRVLRKAAKAAAGPGSFVTARDSLAGNRKHQQGTLAGSIKYEASWKGPGRQLRGLDEHYTEVTLLVISQEAERTVSLAGTPRSPSLEGSTTPHPGLHLCLLCPESSSDTSHLETKPASPLTTRQALRRLRMEVSLQSGGSGRRDTIPHP